MAMRPNGASTSRAIATREPGRVKRTTGHQSRTSSPIPPSHSAPETRCSQSLRMLGTRGSAEPGVPRGGDGAEREHDRARRGARAAVAQQRGGDQRHHHERPARPGDVARQVVAHPAGIHAPGRVGRVGDGRHDGGRHRRPREVPAQPALTRADLLQVHAAALVAGVQVRHRPAARAADQQRQQQRRGEHEDRRVERDPGEDPHPARRAPAGRSPARAPRRHPRARRRRTRPRARGRPRSRPCASRRGRRPCRALARA